MKTAVFHYALSALLLLVYLPIPLTATTQADEPDIAAWLAEHPLVSETIRWQDSNGRTRAYPNWSETQKADLYETYQAVWSGQSLELTDPPPNVRRLADDQSVVTVLSKDHAWSLFLAERGEDFDATLDGTITIAKGHRTGTMQLILTPKDNTTADGHKALGVQATSSSGHQALINIKIAADEEMDDDEEDDGEIAFAFVGAVGDQAYTAGAAISALVLPEATGGEGEVTYRVSGLPTGLSFDASTRTISGTPEAATDGAVGSPTRRRTAQEKPSR